MGYYATSLDSNVTIEPSKIEGAFAAINEWKNLFPEQATYYWSTGENLEEVLTDIGFEFESDDDGYLRIYSFYSKWHSQDLVLTAIKDFVQEGSYISFVGEDHEMWRWTPQGVQNAVISWV